MNQKNLISIPLILIIVVLGGYIYFMTDKNNTLSNISTKNNTMNHEVKTASTNKVAIIYFTATGTTKTVAEYIKNATDGELIEIVPEEKYTSSDLDYNNNNSRANKEQNNPSIRPKISNKIDVTLYDTIYLGFPIWWGDVPKIVLTFLDTYDLTNKTVIPFCTSHSSGIDGSLTTLKNYNRDIKWIDGKRFENTNQLEINDWIESLNN